MKHVMSWSNQVQISIKMFVKPRATFKAILNVWRAAEVTSSGQLSEKIEKIRDIDNFQAPYFFFPKPTEAICFHKPM